MEKGKKMELPEVLFLKKSEKEALKWIFIVNVPGHWLLRMASPGRRQAVRERHTGSPRQSGQGSRCQGPRTYKQNKNTTKIKGVQKVPHCCTELWCSLSAGQGQEPRTQTLNHTNPKPSKNSTQREINEKRKSEQKREQHRGETRKHLTL